MRRSEDDPRPPDVPEPAPSPDPVPAPQPQPGEPDPGPKGAASGLRAEGEHHPHARAFDAARDVAAAGEAAHETHPVAALGFL